MKILLLKRNGRGAGNAVQLSLLLSDIRLKDEQDDLVLSLRDEVWLGGIPLQEGTERKDSYTTWFTHGSAQGRVLESVDSGGRRMLSVTIESADVSEFLSLYRKIYCDWIGIPHQDIPVPKHRLQAPSFIRGIRNDWKEIQAYSRNLYQRLLQLKKKVA